METQVRRYSHNVAGTSSRRSARYSPGASSSYQRGNSMPQPRGVPDLHGRMRKKQELDNLSEQIRILMRDLESLDTLPPSSEVCKMLVGDIESQSDPFLANSGLQHHWDPQWDRWFRGPPIPRSTCCCIPATRQ